MSFDSSRFTFNAWHDFLGVAMQQGRVQLDADWNECVAEMLRRLQAGTLDTFERTVVPQVTPDGFRISAAGGALTIGAGRIYVDGILAENHGSAPVEWDPRLAELVGTTAVDYTAQPYYPFPPELPGGGPHLVYLDVWQREVTHLQHPDLIEKAVGVDTTGRLQTVWQVKLLPDIGAAQCGTPDEDVPGWSALTRPSAARLTTATGDVIDSPDPCLVPPSGGYKGLENQLYRVEIHEGGAAGTARFKWSRDNATVASLVGAINAARDRLVVDSVGRDAVLRFSDGDWLEVTDDVLELHGEPGILRQIRLGGGVDDGTRTLVLTEALPAGVFPTGGQNQTEAGRHTRVRRWDQAGRVLRENGTLFADLDAAGSDGLIPVPPPGTRLLIENGILVSFSIDGAGGTFRAGDHWSFAARTTDASIEILDAAPPRGTHHHYARLAVVEFPDAESDCRVFWPPEAAVGDDCACDACVTVEGHASGVATIQHAIDALAAGGGVICLEAGTYRLREALRIENAGSLRIVGKGWRTLLVPEGVGGVLSIRDSIGVAVEGCAAAGAAGGNAAQALITAHNTVALDLDHLYLLAISPGDAVSVGIELSGYALGASVRQCAMLADIGIAGAREKDSRLLTASLTIADNLLFCNQSGLVLGGRSIHYGDTTIARNLVLRARQSGLSALGGALPGSAFRIDANTLLVAGEAIVAGVDGLRITDNEIRGTGDKQDGHGIVLTDGLDPTGIAHVWVTGNRIANLAGSAVEVRASLGSAMIAQNVCERTQGGIVFVEGGASAHLSIENNQFLQIAAGYNPAGISVVGIQVIAAQDVAIVGNVISNFAEDALQASDRSAIKVVASGAVRVTGNLLRDLGPRQAHAGYVAGIEILAPYSRGLANDNVILRDAVGDLADSRWFALRIGVAEQGFASVAGAMILSADADQAFVLTRTRMRMVSRLPARSLTIRGNQGFARLIASQLVLATGAANCLFTENHFEAGPGPNTRGRLVEINAGTVIASNNRLHWTDNDQDALNISGAKAFTVVGNITMGNIRIEGNALPTPWDALNVLAS